MAEETTSTEPIAAVFMKPGEYLGEIAARNLTVAEFEALTPGQRELCVTSGLYIVTAEGDGLLPDSPALEGHSIAPSVEVAPSVESLLAASAGAQGGISTDPEAGVLTNSGSMAPMVAGSPLKPGDVVVNTTLPDGTSAVEKALANLKGAEGTKEE